MVYSVSSAFRYNLLDYKTAFENECSNSKHCCSALCGWLAKQSLEDRLESCSSSLCWIDSSAPFAVAPAVLSSHMATWSCLQSPACIHSHLVYPLFICLFKNSHLNRQNKIKPLQINLKANNTNHLKVKFQIIFKIVCSYEVTTKMYMMKHYMTYKYFYMVCK